MTATPIEKEFMLVELKEFPIHEVVWLNKKEVTVKRLPVSSPQRYVCELISENLEDKQFGNLHFFVNSVKGISNILKRTKINPMDVKIVCANNIDNKRKLGKYEIKKASDKACKINFYTSTCFEGCDIFDKEGKTYVVSEGKNPNTLYDISTLFRQIIGRIRDSEYGSEVYHIHSSSNYTGDVSYNEFKGMTDREYRMSASIIHEYNSEPIHLRKLRVEKWGKEHFQNRFIYTNDDCIFELDENLLNKSLLDYKLKTEVYNKSAYLVQSYKENGLNVESSKYIKYSDKLKANASIKGNFKEAIEEYHLLATTQNWGNNTERLALLKTRYNFIGDAYYQLGIDKIRELDYNITRINRELIKISDRPLVKKIIELVVKKIGYQNSVDLDIAKLSLKEAYEILGIKKTATASKLKDYFIVAESSILKEGKTIKQIELIREKIILTEDEDLVD